MAVCVQSIYAGRNAHEIIKKDTKEPEDQTEDADSIELFYQVSSISKVNFPDMWLKELMSKEKIILYSNWILELRLIFYH
jgi:hypothetical protein